MKIFRIFSVMFLFLGCFVNWTFSAPHTENCALNDGLLFDKTFVSSDIKLPTGGVKEDIPKKFAQKYQRWKDELLATEFGNRQWKEYSENTKFALTITVSDKEKQGAGTKNYVWNEAGELIGATIVLGNKIDKGFPDPIYFPVMNSLSLSKLTHEVKGSVLAATKIAHEFGHVNLTLKTQKDLFQLQNNLMPEYNQILLGNGYNVADKRLLDLTDQMGGTPVKVWENREYWGEANAMFYLLDRFGKEDFYCTVLNKIEYNVNTYAKDYKDRFSQISESKSIEVCEE